MWQQDSLIKAVSDKAKKSGVQPGMTTSTAKTIIADLTIVPSDPEDDRKFLNLISEWCYNYTARVSVDQSRHYLPGDENLWLDFTGTAHLFGGEKKTLTDLSDRLTNFGLNHYISIADTPGAAWAAARFIQNDLKRVFIFKPGEQKTLLPILPVEALRLSDQILKDLNSLGLYKIKDLQNMNREALILRFGSEPILRLDQALGYVNEIITFKKVSPRFSAKINLPEPISDFEYLKAALNKILNRVCSKLSDANRGSRQLELTFQGAFGKTEKIIIKTVAPNRDPNYLFRLFVEKINSLNIGFAVESMTLISNITNVMSLKQNNFRIFKKHGQKVGFFSLVERFSNRFGKDSVAYLKQTPHHLPEYASQGTHPLAYIGSELPAINLDNAPESPRPLCLLKTPIAITVLTSVSDSLPRIIYWENTSYKLVWANGPERIKNLWWDKNSQYLKLDVNQTRDYYIVQDTTGLRFWVFRACSNNSMQNLKWYLHGFFP